MNPNSRIPLFLALTLSLTLSFAQAPILWTSSWSPDGAHILVGGDDGILRVYDGSTFELLRRDTLSADHPILRMDWHPKENVVAIGMGGPELYFLNFDNGEQKTITGYAGCSRGIGWNHNGKLLAAGDGEGVIHIWTRKGKHLRSMDKGDTKSYVGLDWHPHKNQLIGISQYIWRYNHRGKLLQLTQHREEEVLLLCLQWHPSGDFYILGDYGDTNVPHPAVLQLWKDDGTRLHQFWGSEGPYRNIRWSPDGSMLATASDALRIRSAKGALLFTGESPDLLWGVDWSPDQRYIITSSQEGRVKLWDNKAKLLKDLER